MEMGQAPPILQVEKAGKEEVLTKGWPQYGVCMKNLDIPYC
jgi:hypothetical protein